MNILFVTLFPLERNTSVTISNWGLLRGMKEAGHKVTIMMPNWHVQGIYDLSGYTVIRIPGHMQYPSKHRIVNKLRNKFWILDGTRAYLKSANNVGITDEYFDVVISTSDPKTSHLFVEKLIQRGLKYGRWIQHWGDPLSGDVSNLYVYPEWVIKCVEKSIIRHADKIVYVSPFTKDAQQANYAKLASKIAFVPLPCDESEVEDKSSKKRDKFKVVYMGDYISKYRNIVPLYKACQVLSDVQLSIAGAGDIDVPPCGNISISPRVPQPIAQQYEGEADVIVAVCNRSGTQIPGKIYYKAHLQKHILVVIDGDDPEAIMKYLKQFSRYELTYNNEEAIKEAILSLKNKPCAYICPEGLKPVNVVNRILE